MNNECPVIQSKKNLVEYLTKEVKAMNTHDSNTRINAMWLELTGCGGNIISLLNSENPSAYTVITEIANFTFNNTLMAKEGEQAFEVFLKTLETEFILFVEGAVATRNNGEDTVIANYQERPITGLEAVKMAGEGAKYVVAVGTCASYGGISAASPNPTQSVSVQEVLDRVVIRLPGCPAHPDWVVGTLAYLLRYGMPDLDEEGRPVMFYGRTIHDQCTRRGYFEQQIFATHFGEPGCMFQIGCRGPVTRTDCPVRNWNGYVNWPVGANTNCIGCAHSNFPDGMQPFVS